LRKRNTPSAIRARMTRGTVTPAAILIPVLDMCDEDEDEGEDEGGSVEPESFDSVAVAICVVVAVEF
jgi:hypothetical protein